VDPEKDGSVVQEMNSAGKLLGYAGFVPEP
jgi:hypothetical protein